MNRKTSGWEGYSVEELRQRWDRAHVYLYSQVDSTNARGLELAGGGAPAGTIVLADEQTAGRGVAARRWHSPAGSGLYLSIVLRPAELSNPLMLPLLVGLAGATAVRRTIGGGRVALKWPNDIIVSDRKAGGVLSEASWAGSRPNYVVVGIGINVHQKSGDFPAALRDTAISLDMAAGRKISRLELADHVIQEVEQRCLRLPDTLEPETLRLLDQYDWLRDRHCAISVSDAGPVQGTAVGIAADGALLFRPDGGALERVPLGHVLVDELPTPEF